MYFARSEKLGETATFSPNSMLLSLHRTVNTGSANLKWIHDRLKNHTQATIAFDDGRYVGVAGSLIGSFRIKTVTGDAVVRTNRPPKNEREAAVLSQRRYLL